MISLAVPPALAAVAAVLAIGQRNSARRQASLEPPRQLAAVSESQSGSNLGVSLVLAADAVRRDDNPQTRSALMHAAFASPHLMRYVDVGGRVTQLAGGGDGQADVTAGLADGRVPRWTVQDPKPVQTVKLTKEIKQLAVDDSGNTVAASEGDGFALIKSPRAALWRKGQGASDIRVPAGQVPGSVGISPNGGVVLVHGAAIASGGASSISKLDGKTGKIVRIFPIDPDSAIGSAVLVLPTARPWSTTAPMAPTITAH